MSKTDPSGQPAWRPERFTLSLFLSFVGGYFLSYALRSVNATIAPLLAADLSLSAGALGWLSSAYFLSFASVQWHLGTWLDRYGARRTESVLLMIAAVGSVILAMSNSLFTLSIGRILIGLGVAACLMAPYSYFRRCFAPEKQAQLAMWMLIGGTLGSLTATQPALLLAQAYGWREIFMVCAALLAVSAISIAIFVPDADRQHTQNNNSTDQPKPVRLLELLAHPMLLRIIPTTIFFSGGFVALQSLWVGPWMTDTLGLSTNEAGQALLYFNLALLIAYLAMSFVSPQLDKRGIGLARQTLMGFYWFIICMVVIIAWRSPSAWWLWLVLAPGIPAVILMQTQTALMFPREVAGRVLTTFNLIMFAGAFAVQWGIGLIVDGFIALGLVRADAMTAAFTLLLVAQVVSLWFYVSRNKPLTTGD